MPRFGGFAALRTAAVGASLVGLCLATLACMGGGSRRPNVTPTPGQPSPGVASQLRGRWTLASLEAQGQARRATGQVTFDEFDNIVLRVEIDAGEPGITPPRTVLLDFVAKAYVQPSGRDLAYMGLQQRTPADQMVPSASEPSAWHHFSVEGDTLRLWLENEEGRPVGVMVFQRER